MSEHDPLARDPFSRFSEHLAQAGDRRAAGSPHRSAESWRSRSARLTLVAAAAIAVVTGIAAFVVRSDPAAADVQVERQGDTVTVTLEGAVTIAELRDELERAGVEVTVRPQVTGPSRRNRFVGMTAPPDARLEGGDGTAAPVATFTYGSKVQLMLGVAGPRDQPYDVPTDPTAAGEPLAGRTVIGVTVGDLKTLVSQSNTQLRLDYRNAQGRPETTPHPENLVLAASMTSPTTLTIVLSP